MISPLVACQTPPLLAIAATLSTVRTLSDRMVSGVFLASLWSAPPCLRHNPNELRSASYIMVASILRSYSQKWSESRKVSFGSGLLSEMMGGLRFRTRRTPNCSVLRRGQALREDVWATFEPRLRIWVYMSPSLKCPLCWQSIERSWAGPWSLLLLRNKSCER
jgi:hypothetical protein